ncbi:MAG: response regulator [Sandaracinaceae bacterium]|nr:response regulator [Sandaracinaceae bacterium]
MRPITRRVRKSGVPPRRILVADDSAPLRTTLRLLLSCSAPDVEVLEAADGFAALRVLDEGGVDILVCDLTMPGLDGRKLNHILASRPDRPDVIVMSGSAPARGEAWMHDSVIGWLEKPFDPDALLELVNGPAPARQTAS